LAVVVAVLAVFQRQAQMAVLEWLLLLTQVLTLAQLRQVLA
jgi:hypothetical protein